MRHRDEDEDGTGSRAGRKRASPEDELRRKVGTAVSFYGSGNYRSNVAYSCVKVLFSSVALGEEETIY